MSDTTQATTILALTDLPQEERTLLGIPTMTDAVLCIKMDEASDWIERETQNKFVARMVTEYRTIDEPMTKMFLLFRPLFDIATLPGGYTGDLEAMTIFDPTDTEFTDPVSTDLSTGIVYGNFFTLLNSSGLRAPWKFIYPAGYYLTKASIPPALKNACKQVLAWRWRVETQRENGDMVPILIKQALTGFYSAGAVCW